MEAATHDYGSIGWAVRHLRHGHAMRRSSWPDKMFVVYGAVDTALPDGVLKLHDTYGNVIDWAVPQVDLLAMDWVHQDPTLPGESHVVE